MDVNGNDGNNISLGAQLHEFATVKNILIVATGVCIVDLGFAIARKFEKYMDKQIDKLNDSGKGQSR